MTRDDIIRMAQKTGWDFGWEMTFEQVCEFAALVAAAEREANAKLVDEEMADYRYGTPPNIALNNAAAAIRERGAP
jgi:hypothetical protein